MRLNCSAWFLAWRQCTLCRWRRCVAPKQRTCSALSSITIEKFVPFSSRLVLFVVVLDRLQSIGSRDGIIAVMHYQSSKCDYAVAVCMTCVQRQNHTPSPVIREWRLMTEIIRAFTEAELKFATVRVCCALCCVCQQNALLAIVTLRSVQRMQDREMSSENWISLMTDVGAWGRKCLTDGGERSTALNEFCLLGYNTVQSVGSQPTFRRNLAPPSSGWQVSVNYEQR
jgi:hypothetical protein